MRVNRRELGAQPLNPFAHGLLHISRVQTRFAAAHFANEGPTAGVLADLLEESAAHQLSGVDRAFLPVTEADPANGIVGIGRIYKRNGGLDEFIVRVGGQFPLGENGRD